MSLRALARAVHRDPSYLLTAADFSLAKAIDAIAARRGAKPA